MILNSTYYKKILWVPQESFELFNFSHSTIHLGTQKNLDIPIQWYENNRRTSITPQVNQSTRTARCGDVGNARLCV